MRQTFQLAAAKFRATGDASPTSRGFSRGWNRGYFMSESVGPSVPGIGRTFACPISSGGLKCDRACSSHFFLPFSAGPRIPGRLQTSSHSPYDDVDGRIPESETA